MFGGLGQKFMDLVKENPTEDKIKCYEIHRPNIQAGLAWKSFNQNHLELSQEIKKIILNS